MKIGSDLLTTPLFIIKKLQRDSFRARAAFLKGRVLDAGCGSQPYRRYVACDEYRGIDEARCVAADGIRASVEAIPFRDNTFDSIICTEVLEHVGEPAKAFEEIHRVLKTGGHLYLTTPQSWGLHYEPYDYWRFTRYGLERLVTGARLRVVTMERIGGIVTLTGQEIVDALWALLRRLLSFMGMRWAERVSTGLCLPLSIFFYVAGKVGDRLDARYALGWALVAVK